MRLRDIEVANDDYERQARNTTSSLEDLESKYNVAIERGVLLEEEIRNGEQEREALRIEAQRLRDELSDLKIETDIVQEKLRRAEYQAGRRRRPAPLDPTRMHTPDVPEHSPVTTASSPTVATPPAKSVSSVTSVTPPSPPESYRKLGADHSRPRVSITDLNGTSRPGYGSQVRRHTRAASITSNGRSPSISSHASVSRLSASGYSSGIPKSGSLYQIRGLIGKMQKLEERVQSAKSRLPAPMDTPPSRASPRTGSAMSQSTIPHTVTVRTTRKRTSGSSLSSSTRDGDLTPSYIGRNSIGHGDSRPSSRTSYSSRSSLSYSTYASGIPAPRPESRTRTPISHYSTNSTSDRPRSSMSNYGAPSNNYSASMAHIHENGDVTLPITTPTIRRGTFNRESPGSRSAIPTPGGLKKRPSGNFATVRTPRKINAGLDRRDSDMGRSRHTGRSERSNTYGDLGETY